VRKNDPLGRTWKRGTSYIPPSVVEIDPITIAIVSPPVAGVILYEVVDLKPAIAFVTVYMAAQIKLDLGIVMLRGALAPI